jgi:hypothetical protein
MKVITIEEHVLNPAVASASAAAMQQLNPYWAAAFSPEDIAHRNAERLMPSLA